MECHEKILTLQDIINQQKGENGRPKISKKEKKSSKQVKDYSTLDITKDENKPRLGRQKRKEEIIIHDTFVQKVNKSILPHDAVFKGLVETTHQDIKISLYNVKLLCEKWWSPSESRTYIAERPPGYKGEFGPGLKALIIGLKAIGNMSEPKIHSLISYFGIQISDSTISRIITDDNEKFHKEASDIKEAGIESSVYTQSDTTGANVCGEQWNTHIFCNEFFTAFKTVPHRDRITFIKLISGENECKCLFNDETFALINKMQVPQKWISTLQNSLNNLILDFEELKQRLGEVFGSEKYKAYKDRVMESAMIAYYQTQTKFPIIQVLLTDDASFYDYITSYHALCWVHEIRHYKKLMPKTPIFQQITQDFLGKLSKFYKSLKEYKKNPTADEYLNIENEFENLFSTTTGYLDLDDRIKKTYRKKEQLLTVLDFPQVPLHNNDAELGARARVRYRDVSLHTITLAGTKAVDSYLTIVYSAIKLGVNPYKHITDMITNNSSWISLAQRIRWKSQSLCIGDNSNLIKSEDAQLTPTTALP